MRLLSDELLKAWQGLGKISYDLTPREQSSLMFRRSIYVVHDIKAGELFTSKNIRIIRPGAGLQPKYYDILIGKRSSRDIRRGEPLKWEFVV